MGDRSSRPRRASSPTATLRAGGSRCTGGQSTREVRSSAACGYVRSSDERNVSGHRREGARARSSSRHGGHMKIVSTTSAAFAIALSLPLAGCDAGPREGTYDQVFTEGSPMAQSGYKGTLVIEPDNRFRYQMPMVSIS